MNLDAGIIEVNLQDIIPNRFQPRLNFDEKALNELADSIKQHGIIQPLVLRKIGDKYEIIAGERRYKAATLAGLMKVPAVIANIDDNTSAEVALVENIQRRDLTAIEEAKSYKNLLDKGYLTQEQLAKRLGLSQSAVSNKMRLLNLAPEVQDALLGEKISERHARALLQLENSADQIEWLNKIIRDRLTVRQLDMELKKLKQSTEGSEADIPLVNLTPNIESIKENAMDINPEPEPKVVEDFFPEQPAEEQKLEATTLVADATDPTPRKFFNFLEDEAANLDTGGDISTSSSLVSPEAPMVSPNLEPNMQPAEIQPQINITSEPMIQPQESIQVDPIIAQPQMTSQTVTQSSIMDPMPINNNQMTLEQPILMQKEQMENQPLMEPQIEVLDMTMTQPEISPVPQSMQPSVAPTMEQPQFTPEPLMEAPQSIAEPSQVPNIMPVTNDPVIEQPQVASTYQDQPINPISYNEGPQTLAPQYDPQPMNQPQMMDSIPEITPTVEQPQTSNTILYDVQKQDINITDPISMIDRLDPEYQNKQDAQRGQDLKTAINLIRDRAREIENRGFIVDIDEIDFEDSYQMTIKIEKDNK